MSSDYSMMGAVAKRFYVFCIGALLGGLVLGFTVGAGIVYSASPKDRTAEIEGLQKNHRSVTKRLVNLIEAVERKGLQTRFRDRDDSVEVVALMTPEDFEEQIRLLKAEHLNRR